MKTIMVWMLSVFAIASNAQQVNNFKLVNVLNNQPVSLDTYPSCEGLVIIFTTNNCAYDEYYRGRIAQFTKAYPDRIPVLLVNPSTEPADGPDNMAKKANEWKLTVPYLADKEQTLMTTLDAKKSPEVFLLKNNGGKFDVVYRGAIDDNPQVEADVRHHYLKDAMDILLANQKIETAEVRPVGCNLKKR